MTVLQKNISKIQCLDLNRQHESIKSEIFTAFEEVYDQTAFSGGSFVENFEKDFAGFCRTRFAVGVNNGTSALHLALLALGIGPGDEVIVPANTFIATAWAVTYAGATPVFVDCREDTWQIDAEKINEKITTKTKAVIGVHLYGQPFDVAAVSQTCESNGLYLIEDAAQAHGALYKKQAVGGFGEMGCFSFYPGKNLGAYGEGGGITTNNEEYYTHLLSLRNHGCVVRYYHDEVGYNMRMGGLEGASLRIKLKYLPSWNNRRREIAKLYQEQINNPKIKMQFQPSWADSVYHLFVICTEDRMDLQRYLNEHNIHPGFHYPVSCHLQKAYSTLNYQQGDMPHAEYLASHCISLPMYAEMTEEEVSRVIEVLNLY
ncbi:DegT/DnrJ/EryC1/StrS family aminotransferase [Salinimicrobium sp. GXAS 041]|uniref:DegT/DnrJ/EryC1/StrS family aminotransferase n=1 Tax=Salinimicrobium sp. GXAS 041 TaxID=3400806 RepID=UPI003C77F892